ncbi:MAG: ATP-binding protein [Candidatus Heimdallarchaeota archaeon]|nr:ATP-binding protein [Candidatus Heimdallarchaeota archaeon]
MTLEFNGVFYNPRDASFIRRSVKNLGIRLGFNEKDLQEILLVITEMLTNVEKYAKSRADIYAKAWIQENSIIGIEITCTDYGPGISNLNNAFLDGYSTSNSLGLGLGAMKKMSDDLDIKTRLFENQNVSSGTTIIFRKKLPLTSKFEIRENSIDEISENINTIRRNKDKQLVSQRLWKIDGLVRSKSRIQISGDDIVKINEDRYIIAAIIDGLGSGVEAKLASEIAALVIEENHNLGLEELVNLIHQYSLKTIGSQILIVKICKEKNLMEYIGIGNVRGYVLKGVQTKSLHSINGIVGKNIPKLFKISTIEFPNRLPITIVLHSDGISRSWIVEMNKNFLRIPPLELSEKILHLYGKYEDDASIVVIQSN